MKKDYDVIIIGAGPAGLCFAKALADEGLSIALIEKNNVKTLSQPIADGRDLALTRSTQETLKRIGVWDHIPQDEISPLREARVINGSASYFLRFADPHHAEGQAIGAFVSNQNIRQAVWNSLEPYFKNKKVTLITEQEVQSVGTEEMAGSVILKSGKTVTASLVVASDSRFSSSRHSVGIATHKFDFARTCIVARIHHEYPHEQVAYECFNAQMTLAVLPLNQQKSSIVLTLPPHEAEEILALDKDCFSQYITSSFRDRLGEMTLCSKPICYPLIATYATRFIADRFALIGDAAVGMHPVTAHGFNFGVKGAWTLSQLILKAHHLGLDIGAYSLLQKYERQHRRATLPLFFATNTIVQLYSSRHPFLRSLQSGLLRLGNGLKPVQKLIMKRLMRPMPHHRERA